jgi:type II secretory pathway pseudopilin PulG
MRVVLIVVGILVAVALVAMFGTIQAMEKGSPAMQYKVMLSGATTNYALRVTWPTTNEFPVSKTGETVIDVPALPHGCSLICLGIKLTDGSPRRRKVIDVLKGGSVVRRLSLSELDRLPPDSSGTRKLEL